ncbi:hypothetical protein [Pseudonocardia xishanensis]|uniref:ATP-dependent DNA ligase n=1 Tax=Pseudonocardia xishanensis TaxID=630995 RepID=A0ABP8S2U8_9PSEU
MGVEFPVATMVARTGNDLPDDGRHAYEAKLDGWRCVAHVGRRVRLHSRQQRSLTGLFPDVAAGLAELVPEGTVLDGELVAMCDDRADFAALHSGRGQRHLVAFDVLADRGRDIRGEPYRDRRRRLEDLLASARGALRLMPASTDVAVARAWMVDHGGRGVEGVVAKRLDHGYRPRSRFWSKHRTRLSADAIIGGVIGPVEAPTALVLGRHDDRGRLRVVGRTVALQRHASMEVGGLLTRARGPHPWPTVLAGGRLGLPGLDDVEHTPVDPAVVVELDVDTAFEAGRWRHGARLVRVRHDLEAGDLT